MPHLSRERKLSRLQRDRIDRIKPISTTPKGDGASTHLGEIAREGKGGLTGFIPRSVLAKKGFEHDGDMQAGYFNLSDIDRQKTIDNAVRHDGSLTVFKRLNVARTLNRSNPIIDDKATKDMNYIKQHYTDENGKFVNIRTNPVLVSEDGKEIFVDAKPTSEDEISLESDTDIRHEEEKIAEDIATKSPSG